MKKYQEYLTDETSTVSKLQSKWRTKAINKLDSHELNLYNMVRCNLRTTTKDGISVNLPTAMSAYDLKFWMNLDDTRQYFKSIDPARKNLKPEKMGHQPGLEFLKP